MEVLTLPFTANKAKTYKHYSLHSTPAANNLSVAKTEFYYIGSNASRIDKLIRIFESGYATESCDNAKSMLVRLLNHAHPLPYIIICDSLVGYEAIRDFRCFLNGHKDLDTVPFILDDQGMSKELRLRFRKEKIVDEIVSLEEFTKERLLAKARFLNKTKSNSTNGWQKKIETSTTSVCNQYSISKRIFDVIIAAIFLVILSPILLLVALAIKLESKGPILYIAKRAGRGYKIFNFYKFRTMVVGADSKISDYSHLNQYTSTTTLGPKFYKIENDPRITRVGAFLRKTSLDELPQLINVLLGDMSLVGNRPLPLYEAATLTTDEWAKRFLAPAGITGLWQIKKRGNKDMSVEERINLDIYYATKYNFAYDLWIMANTPTALIQKTNA